MKINKQVPAPMRYFLHPRVSVFILTGTAIIFLTFLTTSNALEIAISGIASVFIGIGVNNFSAAGTHVKDAQQIAARMKHIEKLMDMAQAKLEQIQRDDIVIDSDNVKYQLKETEQLVQICIQLLNDYNSRD